MASQAAPARIHKDDPDLRVEAALRLRSENRLGEALHLLSAPGAYSQNAYILRGDLQRDLGLYHDAVGSYSMVTALDPQNGYAQQNLAACLRKLRRWSAAVDAFREILEVDSYSDAARIALGECLLQLNQFEEALAYFEGCWSEAALAPALFGKAVALQMLRQFDAAEALYLRLLEIRPDAEEALCNLIALSLEVFDLTRVERYAKQLLKHNPQSTAALQALTIMTFERGSYDSAAEYYGRLVEIIPEEKLISAGNENVFEYRLSRKSRELLNQARLHLSQRTQTKGH